MSALWNDVTLPIARHVRRRPVGALVVAALVSLGLGGCANAVMGAMTAMQADAERSQVEANKKPELTQLQTRELQTRRYDATDTTNILKVALAVLQDDGFVVTNANSDLGLLSASMNLHEKQVDDAGTAFMKGFFGIGVVSTQKWSTVESTVTVTPFGDETRVRMSARLSAISTNGGTQYQALTEPEFYQAFFTKLEKGLFIEREGL